MIRVLQDLEELSRAAADLFCETARRAVGERGRCDVALAGGSTPRRTYELLATDPWRGLVAWDRLHVFWGDERCVPPDDPRSNARMAREAMLARVPIPPANVHPVACAGDPSGGAAAYEAELRGHFGDRAPPPWDLVLLGLGEDGHTASLFPGGEAVHEALRWAVAVPGRGDGPRRVSLTPVALNGAAAAVFLVSGRRKAEALRRVRSRPPDPDRCPAQVVAPRGGEPLFLADREAAGEPGRGAEATP